MDRSHQDLSGLLALTMTEIITARPPETFSRIERRSRRDLKHAVSRLPEHALEILLDLAKRKIVGNSAETFQETLRSLTKDDITGAFPPRTFTARQKKCRRSLDEACSALPSAMQAVITETAHSKKRKREHFLAESEVEVGSSQKRTKPTDPFFNTVSEECRRSWIAKFIDSTSSKALAISTCAVCAGRFFSSEVQQIQVTQLQEKKKLIPARNHPAHILTYGMLLHRSHDATRLASDGVLWVNTCDSCRKLLLQNKTPPLALANGMWIGDVPSELSILSLPERMLVARYLPTAHIVKLYPKRKGARNWSSQGMQSGVQGNVSTYRLNTADIAEMTDAQIMPPSSSILAATIGVTFVGPKNIPQKTLPAFLRVNRNRVRDALQWLKTNNPLYRSIVISDSRLNALPLDGVPSEIFDLVRHCEDVNVLDAETGSYIPNDVCDADGKCELPFLSDFS